MEESNDERRRGRRRARARTPLSLESLERAALRYVERYDSTEANLRRVLERKVYRELAGADSDPELRDEAQGWIREVVALAAERRWVDDRRYAEALVQLSQRRGISHRATWQKLRQKGVSDELIQEQLGTGPEAESELAAAAAYARRRGLGPWRAEAQRELRRERDLASLARAGFDFSVARTIVEAEDPEALPDVRRPGALF